MISPRPTHARSFALWLVACAAVFAAAGCHPPGKPAPGPEVPRPDQVLDFSTLYSRNCAACHGTNGHNGAAISLANPVYLATAGVTNIQRITADGVPNTAMPPFGNAKGGMLTDQQIAILANGLLQAWGNPTALAGQNPPPYASSAPGNTANGQQAFTTFCAPCHGADGTGGKTRSGALIGSLVDPAYLALVSDQGLRSIVIAGQPDQGMPAWNTRTNGIAGRPITDQEIADVVAWLTSHRIATPGSPYKPHP